jgi:hypothetical protein
MRVGEMLWLRLPLGRATMSMGSTANFAAVLVLPTPLAIPAACWPRSPIERTRHAQAARRARSSTPRAPRWPWARPGSCSSRSRPRARSRCATRGSCSCSSAAAATYYLINRSLVTAGCWRSTARCRCHWLWRRNFGWSRDLIPCGAALSLGVLLAELHQHAGPVALAFVLLPALIVFEAHRRRYTASATPLEAHEPSLERAKRAVNG